MKTITVGNKSIGEGNPCCISFEPSAGYSDFEGAKSMIKATAAAGADAIKFQTFLPGDAKRLMAKDSLVKFSTPTGTKEESIYEALKKRELTKNEWKGLINFSKDLDLLFITTPVFIETVDFLADTNVDLLKVSKGDVDNVLLIDHMAKTHIPIILDGREKFENVDIAIKICEKNQNENIIVLHCPSGYPVENAGVHLNTLQSISQKYNYPIGFADHSPGGIMNYAAVALGSKMVEKTITTDKSIEHVEHFMSLEPTELKNFVENIRAIEAAMGDPNIFLTSRVDASIRRGIVAKYDIQKGEKISLESLDFQRPSTMGIPCSDGFDVISKKAAVDIQKNTFLKWEMLE
jgi:N,N'-diacetyllegionaminate synthase